MDKKKILFVDDEPNILSGLKRMLRSLRKEYEFNFAEDGFSALEMMKNDSFDIVVSDMRMPGMDGAELLKQVQTLYPSSIRIMLTGQADEESVMRTVGVVHQFLAKPCEPEKLKEIIQNASALQNLIHAEKLVNIVNSIDYLPTIPAVYMKLQERLLSSEAAIDEIGQIIEADLGLSAKVLQLVNSAFFGLYKKVDSPTRAVSLLGLDTIKSLVLGTEVFNDSAISSTNISLEELWSHSFFVGNCAKKIMEATVQDKEKSDVALLAGMLHDIGKMIMDSQLDVQYRMAVELKKEKRMSSHTAEKIIFSASHAEVGAYLVGLWGLNSTVIEGIAFHHNISQYPSNEMSPALAIHVANALYYECSKKEPDIEENRLDVEHITSLGLEQHLDSWREISFKMLEEGNE